MSRRGERRHGWSGLHRMTSEQKTPFLARILEAAEGCCVYCGRPLHVNGQGVYDPERWPMSVDHVFPKRRGGRNRVSNFVASCHPCNTEKGGQLVEEWRPGRRGAVNRAIARLKQLELDDPLTTVSLRK